MRRGEATCVVDLVLDRAPAIEGQKRQVGGLAVDTLREMTANKVAALVGRSELRDLVDLERLLAAGQSLEQALEDAGKKDAGVDPAIVAWTLSQLRIGPEAKLPAGADPVSLESFRAALVNRLRRVALPPTR